MSIVLLHGDTGGGKSLSAVKRWIIPALARGQHVFTNLDVVPFPCTEYDLEKERLGDKSGREFKPGVFQYLREEGYEVPPEYLHLLDPSQMPQLQTFTSRGAMIVVEEPQFYFRSGLAKKEHEDFFDFCTVHRHDDNELVFVTQDIKNISRKIRSLVKFAYTFEDASEYPMPGLRGVGKFILKTAVKCGMPEFRVNMYKRTGEHVDGPWWWRKDPRIFGVYRTKSRHDHGYIRRLELPPSPAVRRLEKRKDKKRMVYVYLLAIVVGLSGLGLWGCTHGTKGLLSGGIDIKAKAASASPLPPPPVLSVRGSGPDGARPVTVTNTVQAAVSCPPSIRALGRLGDDWLLPGNVWAVPGAKVDGYGTVLTVSGNRMMVDRGTLEPSTVLIVEP